ncbi:competence/damage-inducible protein A [Vulcanibacillus modesticaldus]|uniref:Putative competence-damage inducible protein n=1 Tax=Vulcanibacillus modesticaldus TaxID=337097 RepID=A0A1D2YXL8_9BACI|nr:competence/damage-inducible protein A [Vulcanibacillus modesticaldus]
MYKGEIIAVGTELLLGQIANTNAQYISRKMAEIGIPIYFHVTVGDNEQRLKEAIIQAQKRSNIIIFTGGLGPTQDDITKEVAADLMNKRMLLHQSTYEKIKDYFIQRRIKMTENNIKQAMIIEGSTVFPNNYGLAAGLGLEIGEITYIFLPGPPSEMKPMLEHFVAPWLVKRNQGQTFHSKIMRFAGIGESLLEDKVVDIIENQSNPTVALYANEGEVTIRLTARAEDESAALSIIYPIEKEIHNRLQDYHFGYGEEKIEQVVFRFLNELNLTISVSESCTGGLIGRQITKIPGSSLVYKGGVICYTNEIKSKILQVPEEILEEYGAVSMETAKILAENTLKLFNTDIGISITGIAGPDKVEGKPVGLTYIGISEKGKETVVKEIHLSGNRQSIQWRAAKYVFYFLWDRLRERLNDKE